MKLCSPNGNSNCSFFSFFFSMHVLLSQALCLPLLSTFLQPPSFSLSLSAPSRFHGNDRCVCGDVSVTEQYSQIQWDTFAGEVLDSLYNTAPVSMHCNQSTARLFPVSLTHTHTHTHTRMHACYNRLPSRQLKQFKGRCQLDAVRTDSFLTFNIHTDTHTHTHTHTQLDV